MRLFFSIIEITPESRSEIKSGHKNAIIDILNTPNCIEKEIIQNTPQRITYLIISEHTGELKEDESSLTGDIYYDSDHPSQIQYKIYKHFKRKFSVQFTTFTEEFFTSGDFEQIIYKEEFKLGVNFRDSYVDLFNINDTSRFPEKAFLNERFEYIKNNLLISTSSESMETFRKKLLLLFDNSSKVTTIPKTLIEEENNSVIDSTDIEPDTAEELPF